MPKFNVNRILQSTISLNKSRANIGSFANFELVNTIPYKGVKSLLVQTKLQGESSPKSRYNVNILFQDVEFADTETQGYLKLTYRGEDFWIKPIQPTQNPIKVRCTCKDFRYTFAYYNSKQGALFGREPKAYQRKTKRQSRNPNKVVGACKHILYSLKVLKQSNIVK